MTSPLRTSPASWGQSASAGRSKTVLSGCVRGVQPYPSTWRPLPPANDCNAIAGTYKNLGEGTKGRGEPLFTLLVAVHDHQKPRRSGDSAPGTVTISMPEPGVLEARTGSLSQRFLGRDHDFQCSDGVLEFARTGGTSSNMGAWLGSTVVRVGKDQDGRVVVSRDERGFALLGYVIPIYMGFVSWTRFEPVIAGDAHEAAPENRQDTIEVLAVASPALRAAGGFIRFETKATVRYALHSADRALLQISAVRYRTAGCLPGTSFVMQAGSMVPIARGAGTQLVRVEWLVKADLPEFDGVPQHYVTVQSALYQAGPAQRPTRLIRGHSHHVDFCFAVTTPDSRDSKH
jgi:hypothetical protein